ncbi:helix-turn-helix domain-containing protein [Actinoplanes sp. CA-142083]|uniref:helix-turn-helix domain-containing protein n=1 Tax=Actinoplanes sp. CA-142083 TaxID=3239903 RepID=UPI003D926605
MEIDDLGARLRHLRVASGRTIAAVAADAGLSVPYIANLENGRGNPTLSAVNRLAAALGARLTVEVGDHQPAQGSPVLPETLVQFARSQRFKVECALLAEAAEVPEPVIRLRLLTAMAAMGALTDRPPSELDWHRVLDTAALITRQTRN